MPAPLEIRVLGELEVVRGGKTLPLPASKKTRALLGYLVVVGARPQPRQRLCELFWDGPDDPRAALRWSLAKVRPLVDDAKATRIVADREHVGFEPCGAIVDLALVRQDAASMAGASLGALRNAAAQFRGELLEGLDLPECYRYHEWCVAARAAARRVRGAILAILADRLADQPDGTSPAAPPGRGQDLERTSPAPPGRGQHLEEALGCARAWVTIDPLSEGGHIAVMRLLAKLGRPREAIKQYESCRRILEAQLGRSPSKELEAARSTLGRAPPTLPDGTSPAPPGRGQYLERTSPAPPGRGQYRTEVANARTLQREARTSLVGRSAERATIAAAVCEAAEGRCTRVLLLVGEPGIGKTRLLEEVADRVMALGGATLCGRAFEAEMVRPYGAWIDVLRSAPPGAIDATLRADVSPLLPELGASHGDADRNGLFDAVGKLLLNRAASAPLAVVLDDIQWFDEASAALMHYVARSVAGSRVLLACAARAAEIDGNPRVRALVRALVREGRLERVELAPLDADATNELVRSVDGRLDAAQIFADGGGNPLFSLELARTLAAGDSGAAAHTLDGLIAERLSRLDERAAELLPWAAALGHAFCIDTLAALTSLPVRDLLAAVDELERHGVLRVASPALGSVGYDFAHDLVRRAAYRAMSEPRRRWMHLHVARTLHATGDPEGAIAGDIAHHAALGGDSELAARAYVAAGERCLRLFAYADASKLAASGIQHVDRLPPEVAIRVRLALLAVQVHSNQWLRRPHELEAELSRVALAAQRRGMHAEVARAFYLMSFVHHERGDFAHASALSLQAAHAGRAGDIETRQHQLANTGRCLILIERDVAHAEELLSEALSFGLDVTGRTSLEMTFGMGLLHAFKGEDAEAVPLLERGAELAALESDHWTHSQALTWVARLALDAGRPREALARCVALEPLVAKLPEGSEGPFVDALGALARLALGEVGAPSAVEAALATLRTIDSKAHLAYALDVLAEQDAHAGRASDAHRRGEEALRAAEAVGQKSEAAVARSLLARLAFDRGDRGEALALLNVCVPDLATPLALSARARVAVVRAAERVGFALPATDSQLTTEPTASPPRPLSP
jgi:DNA-binding SARP family transcriptional activator/tetratricopeptide (TPR) repeat protein